MRNRRAGFNRLSLDAAASVFFGFKFEEPINLFKYKDISSLATGRGLYRKGYAG
jgi:hypothetical protein